MSLKKKKSKKKNYFLFYFRLTSFILIMAISLYYIQKIFTDISRSVIQTHIIDLGEVKNTINKDVVIIRKSKPIKSERDGIVTRFYNHGDRVPKGVAIFKVQDSPTKDNEVEKLENINEQIERMQKSSSYFLDVENSQIGGDIGYAYMEIQESIENNDLRNVSKLKKELIALNTKKETISGQSNNGVTLQDLYNEKASLEGKIANNNTYVRSDISGDISYYYDEYYDLFSFENMNKISVKDIVNAKNNSKKIDDMQIKKGDLLGYVVDNHNYYMATEVDKDDIENIKRDVALLINADDIFFNAYFYNFFRDKNNKYVGIFKVESEDFDFLKNRKENVDIVFSSAKGILIPNTAIIEKDGKTGVYIVDEVGIAKFYELNNVLLSDGKNTVISFSYDDFSEKNKIKLYDEVILSPKNIKDGQKVK